MRNKGNNISPVLISNDYQNHKSFETKRPRINTLQVPNNNNASNNKIIKTPGQPTSPQNSIVMSLASNEALAQHIHNNLESSEINDSSLRPQSEATHENKLPLKLKN